MIKAVSHIVKSQLTPLLVLPIHYIVPYLPDQWLYTVLLRTVDVEGFGADNLKSVFDAVRAGLDAMIGVVILIYALRMIHSRWDNDNNRDDI